jgi:predicted dehydrogenase/threonine dehydrogenase-like Zn-dependent dehydrogenase
MRILTQNYLNGELDLSDIPAPTVTDDGLIVETRASEVSIGTELAMISLARKSLLGKAIERPDWVRQVAAKVRTEGAPEAFRQSRARLKSSVPLGYSSCGVVTQVGLNHDEFALGDYVVCFGSGVASHAEYQSVPSENCLRKPDDVAVEDAAFAALGGIALEAVRLAEVGVGQRVAVIGLGLLGLLTVQILKASGCRVFGIDPAQERLSIAKASGCDFVSASSYNQNIVLGEQYSDGLGFDSVIIMAATKSTQPLDLAASLSIERGRIVAAGLVRLDVPREKFFAKELSLRVSRAWGPGATEGERNNFSIPYPRWSAKENIRAFLGLAEERKVDVRSLVTLEVKFEDSKTIYEELLNNKRKELGVVLSYKARAPQNIEKEIQRRVELPKSGKENNRRFGRENKTISIGLIGSGQYASGTFLPALKKITNLSLKGIASKRGLSAAELGRIYDFSYATSDYLQILRDSEIDLVCILTRHGDHARLTSEALRANKDVFVEKPLALSLEQLKEVIQAYRENPDRILRVGFNRRFAPTAQEIKKQFSQFKSPLVVNCRVNAGKVPSNSWVYHKEIGGGRIIGEVCHFVDLLQFFSSSLVEYVYAASLKCGDYKKEDNVLITVNMQDGSVGTISYLANGDKSAPRERIEIFGGGAIGIIDNFKTASFSCSGKKKRFGNPLVIDKGGRALLEELVSAVRHGGNSCGSDLESLINVSYATFAILRSLQTGKKESVNRYSQA